MFCQGDFVNIVYVSDQYWPSVSGVPVSMDSFRESFTNKGHRISLLVPDYPEAAEWDRDHNPKNLFRFKSRSIFFNKENRLVHRSEKKKIHDRLDAIKPDIIHIHTEFTMAKIVIKYAKRKNIPLVLTAHTNWEELINEYIKFIPLRLARFYCRSILRRMFNKMDVVIVPTSLMETRLLEYYVRSPIQVIPTGINVDQFSRTIEEEKICPNEILLSLSERIKDHKTLLYVGRLGREKNIKFLIDAFSKIAENDNNIK